MNEYNILIFGNSNLNFQTNEGKIKRWNSKVVGNVLVKMHALRIIKESWRRIGDCLFCLAARVPGYI
jgi:hypothetical protein